MGELERLGAGWQARGLDAGVAVPAAFSPNSPLARRGEKERGGEEELSISDGMHHHSCVVIAGPSLHRNPCTLHHAPCTIHPWCGGVIWLLLTSARGSRRLGSLPTVADVNRCSFRDVPARRGGRGEGCEAGCSALGGGALLGSGGSHVPPRPIGTPPYRGVAPLCVRAGRDPSATPCASNSVPREGLVGSNKFLQHFFGSGLKRHWRDASRQLVWQVLQDYRTQCVD